ncbi:G-type lectin S-receptor-like serine/threonine-protein kinase SD2-5 [Triticum dicoccoides]|uniref:G-type lectin S-receptor-like serine/threonine-protein kinase SD2-5 n=1 Tax=Triticum dicoccoides TaxID=85692 RepID=UPI000843606D|nr:G-type lectin S-receptor-like serine/threonine-protein kinase SD2-5 [Triticum dicoccoides]XP_044338243.1 G-type lectin S-receptor-like serine/threonine-protein kinase SD2-5 isoform X2 [Triticum aestivum]
MLVVSTSSAVRLLPLLVLLPAATIAASTSIDSGVVGGRINQTTAPIAEGPLFAPPYKLTPTPPRHPPAPPAKVTPTMPSALPAAIGTTSMKVKSSSVRRVVAILAPVGGFILLSILFLGTYFIRKRRTQQQYEMEMEEEFGELQGTPMRFTFQQLKAATEQFADKLGEGGFGSVFKGQFGDERIAVKCLDRAGQGKKEFSAEVQTIGSIHHINLVRLIGFCAEKSHRLLVYEYMPKGSLDRWIYHQHDNDSPPLNWSTRCKIITHIAKGLTYLHEECMKKIAHLDVKPQNILLDDNFNAKLSDFGLCKLIDRDMSQVFTRMRGTPGYLAPEWLTSQITEKADVYSFGVVVMEVISGRKNLDNSRSEESIHLITQLEEKIDCKRRPKMSEVVKVLEGAMNAESNIDHNFVATNQVYFGAAGNVVSSVPPLASHVSGPR